MVHCLWVKNSPFHNPSQYIASCSFFQFFDVLSIVFKNGHLFSFVWLCDWFSCKRVFCTLMYKSCTWVSCAPLGDMKNNHTDDRKYCRGCATQRVNETFPLKHNPPKVDLLNTYTAIIIVYFHLFICSFCYDSMIHFINYIKRVNISSKTLSFVFVIQYNRLLTIMTI